MSTFATVGRLINTAIRLGMETTRKRNGMAAVALLCGLVLTSTTVSAQQPPADDWQFVPVGPPVSNLDE